MPPSFLIRPQHYLFFFLRKIFFNELIFLRSLYRLLMRFLWFNRYQTARQYCNKSLSWILTFPSIISPAVRSALYSNILNAPKLKSLSRENTLCCNSHLPTTTSLPSKSASRPPKSCRAPNASLLPLMRWRSFFHESISRHYIVRPTNHWQRTRCLSRHQFLHR